LVFSGDEVVIDCLYVLLVGLVQEHVELMDTVDRRAVCVFDTSSARLMQQSSQGTKDWPRKLDEEDKQFQEGRARMDELPPVDVLDVRDIFK
jgi:hypothetical protein